MKIQYAKTMARMIIDRAAFAKKQYGPSKTYLVQITEEQIEGLETLIADIPEERLSKAIDAGLDRCIKTLEQKL